MLIVMAIKGYGYDPDAKNTAAKRIPNMIQLLGHRIADDTVRNHLKTASEELPGRLAQAARPQTEFGQDITELGQLTFRIVSRYAPFANKRGRTMSHTFRLPEFGFLRLKQILGPLGPIPISKSTWWAGVKDGRYPKPVKLGHRITVWRAWRVFAGSSKPALGETIRAGRRLHASAQPAGHRGTGKSGGRGRLGREREGAVGTQGRLGPAFGRGVNGALRRVHMRVRCRAK